MTKNNDVPRELYFDDIIVTKLMFPSISTHKIPYAILLLMVLLIHYNILALFTLSEIKLFSKLKCNYRDYVICL